MTRPTVVIDGDGHIPNPSVWTDTRAAFRDRVLQVKTEDGHSYVSIEGSTRGIGGGAGRHKRAFRAAWNRATR